MNKIENKGMENGYVVLPVEKYAELLITVEKLNRLVTVRKSYGDDLVAEIDKRTVYDLAKKAYENSTYNKAEYEFREYDAVSVYTVDIARKVTAEEQ